MESNQNQAQTMNQRNTQIAIGVAVVVVVGLLAWWLFSKPAGDAVTMATSTALTDTDSSRAIASADEDNMDVTSNSTAATNESVSVGDQPAGDSVRVASVTLAKAGWVAVRDPLRVYGAAWLTAGTHENVSVPLLRNTSAGTTYTVVLYVDNGDKSFDLHGDAVITGVSDTFSATNGD